MKKSARRWTRKVPPRGPSGAALFRNDIPFGVATGGKPASASNADLMRGNTDLERFGGGQIRGTSEDANAPIHPGRPATNTDYVIPAAIPSWLVEEVRKSKKIAAALDLSGISGDTRPYRDRVETYALDDDGRVLGGAYEVDRGFGVFGGGVDDGEDALEAAAREFGEEAGYELLDPRFVEVDPVTADWSPPYVSDKQAERAKKYRGSRTRFVTGRIGQPREKGRGDDADSGLDDIRFYDIDEADGMLNPETAMDAGLARSRKAVLQALRAARMQKSAGIKVEDVVGKQRSRELRKGLRKDYDDLVNWIRSELRELPSHVEAAAKSAGEENEPSRADHESAPAQQMRPRAEIIVASPEGVYAIDKDDYILFPGGGIDDGEPPLIAAAREAIEEGDFHVLNPMPGGVIESLWPQGVNDFWDDSEFDGERTYFFSAIDGGRLGTKHADQEEFELIPYDTMLKRLDELMEDESAWDYANNAERRRLVAAAADAVGDEEEWKPRKLASAARRLEGWGRYRSGLRRVFMPEEPAEFSRRLMAIEEDVGHVVHEVRKFPTGAVLVVLKSPGVSGGISERDRILARRINAMAKTAKACPTATMALTMGEPHPEEPAAGVLVDIDGTIMDSEWEPNWTGLKHQTPRQGVKPVLEELAARGIRIVGVTNRSGSSDPNGIGVEAVEGYNADVIKAFPEITDIVFCGDYEDPDRKPSGAMLEFAKAHFNIDPVLAMVGDSQDDADAAAAAGAVYLTPEEFFDDTPKREALLAIVDESVASPEGLEKTADAAALLPREEYFYTSPTGEVLARPLDGRRFEFPTTGRGKRAPYSSPLRVIPEEGIGDPGYHGYEYRFNIGRGDPQEFEGGQWVPIQDALRQLYGSMGLSANRPHRDLDRARARVLHRLAKQVQASEPTEKVEEDGVGEGDPRPEAPEVDSGFDLPAAISSGDWAQHERDAVGVAKELLEETSE